MKGQNMKFNKNISLTIKVGGHYFLKLTKVR